MTQTNLHSNMTINLCQAYYIIYTLLVVHNRGPIGNRKRGNQKPLNEGQTIQNTNLHNTTYTTIDWDTWTLLNPVERCELRYSGKEKQLLLH